MELGGWNFALILSLVSYYKYTQLSSNSMNIADSNFGFECY